MLSCQSSLCWPTWFLEARVGNQLRVIIKQTVFFIPLILVVSTSSTTPKAQQHGLPITSKGCWHDSWYNLSKRKHPGEITCVSPNCWSSFHFPLLVGFVVFFCFYIRHGCENLSTAHLLARHVTIFPQNRSSVSCITLWQWCAFHTDLIMWLPAPTRPVAGQSKEMTQRGHVWWFTWESFPRRKS